VKDSRGRSRGQMTGCGWRVDDEGGSQLPGSSTSEIGLHWFIQGAALCPDARRRSPGEVMSRCVTHISLGLYLLQWGLDSNKNRHIGSHNCS
jgi:hypothetical protein